MQIDNNFLVKVDKLKELKKNTKLKPFPYMSKGFGKASVIDLGSNSVKMVNYNVDNHNSYKPYHQESIRVKLAEGLIDDIIQEKHIEHTIEALKLFRNIIDFEQINYEMAVATSAVRDAKNKEEFMKRIQKETGFDFKILSEYEEAIYSYAGAIRSLNLPTVIFFDIGGGSVEIVSAEDFKIKKVVSLPLGSLRLTQQFADHLEFTEKTLSKMRAHVQESLPTRKELGIDDSKEIILVGVGGTLRSIAKYNQEKTKYPLKKLHNYPITWDSLKSIHTELMHQSNSNLTRIATIGSGRADTIKAGIVTIYELMKKFKFPSMIVSAQGLREGTLSLSLQYPDEFSNHKIDAQTVQDLVYLSCQPESIPEHIEDLVYLLFSTHLISDDERTLLAYAIAQIDKLSSFRDVDNVLYSLLDDDSILSHREQLVVALSLIYSKKKKKAESLVLKFKKILKQNDKKSIRKIAAIVSLCDIFHKTGVLLKPTLETRDSISLDIYVLKNAFPEILFQQTCTKTAQTLGIKIKPKIHYKTSEYFTSKPINNI